MGIILSQDQQRIGGEFSVRSLGWDMDALSLSPEIGRYHNVGQVPAFIVAPSVLLTATSTSGSEPIGHCLLSGVFVADMARLQDWIAAIRDLDHLQPAGVAMFTQLDPARRHCRRMNEILEQSFRDSLPPDTDMGGLSWSRQSVEDRYKPLEAKPVPQTPPEPRSSGLFRFLPARS